MNILNDYSDYILEKRDCKDNYRYYVKAKHFDFVEVSKEVFDEIYKWQHNQQLHEIYELRKYRDLYNPTEMEDIADSTDLEDEIVKRIEEDFLKNKLKNILTPIQYEIAYSLIFEEKNQSQIARDRNISRQAVNEYLSYIRKKLKKFNKKP